MGCSNWPISQFQKDEIEYVIYFVCVNCSDMTNYRWCLVVFIWEQFHKTDLTHLTNPTMHQTNIPRMRHFVTPFCYKMVHYGIWDRCTVGFVGCVNFPGANWAIDFWCLVIDGTPFAVHQPVEAAWPSEQRLSKPWRWSLQPRSNYGRPITYWLASRAFEARQIVTGLHLWVET